MSRSRIILRDHNSNVIYKRNTTNGKTYQFALVTYTSMRSAQRKIAISNVANHLANITREHEKYVSRGYRSLLLEVINGEVCLNATQVDYLTGNNDASRETYKMFIPVNPETAADNLKFLNTCARTDTVRRAPQPHGHRVRGALHRRARRRDRRRELRQPRRRDRQSTAGALGLGRHGWRNGRRSRARRQHHQC